MKGTISNVLADKMYGFIAGENGQEYFFHKQDLNGDWTSLCLDWKMSHGEINVSFEPKETPRGPRAANVNLIQN